MLSIKAFGKLLVESKTLGWEHSKRIFENVFENLGVVSIPLNFYENGFILLEMGVKEKGCWWFFK
jgi:hypothetical protein